MILYKEAVNLERGSWDLLIVNFQKACISKSSAYELLLAIKARIIKLSKFNMLWDNDILVSNGDNSNILSESEHDRTGVILWATYKGPNGLWFANEES